MDVSQYLEIFVEETKEHLQSLNDNILVLENEPENKDTINEIFQICPFIKRYGRYNGLQENADPDT